MKLYTRTGDDGTTGLFGGGRIRKDHSRMDAIGDVDELNAAIGLTIAAMSIDESDATPGQRPPKRPSARVETSNVIDSLRTMLTGLQSRLFDLGADLATPLDSAHETRIHRMSSQDIEQAEGWIDKIDSGNSPMKQFVLPGGTELSARLHVARTVCRRAERSLVRLAREAPINDQTIIFLNRVSDLLFAMARRANKEAGVADVPWVPRQ